MSAILELSRLVCSTLDLDEVFSRVLAGIRELSGADTVSIMMLDASGAHLQIVAGLGVSASRYTSMRLRIGEGLAGWVVQHGQPLHLVNPNADPRFLATPGVSYSVLFVVPLHGRAGVLGALNLSRFVLAEEFSSEVTQTVEIFASHAAIAIENAMAAARLRYAAVRERIAGLVVQAPRTPGAATPVVESILGELGQALEASLCALMRPADASGPWSAVVAWPTLRSAAEIPWQPPDSAPAASPYGDPERAAAVAIEQLEEAWLLVRSPNRSRATRLRGDAEQELIRFAGDQIGQLLANERLIAGEQRSRALSKTLSQLASASNAMIGQNEVLDFILAQLKNFISYDSAGVFIYHDERYARMVAGQGFPAARAGIVLYMGPGSLTWELRRTHQVRYEPDVQQIPGWQNVPDSHMIRSWIGVPLLVNDELIGVLTIDKWATNAFNADDVQVAQMFGEHMAVAIQNARLLAEARSQAGQIQVLHQLSLRIATIREVAPLLDVLGRLLYETFGYYQVLIGLVEGDEIVMKTAYGRIDQVDDSNSARRHRVDQGITGWVIRHGQTALVNNVQEDPLYAVHSQLAETAAELVVPIKTGEKVLGMIAIESETTGAFGQGDVQLAEALAGQAAVALENILRYEELRRTQEHLLHSERLRALGELSSGVAHDFNNLLASILGHSQLLLLEDLKDSQLEELRIIERAALDGAATVRRLQSFAQTNLAAPIELADINTIVEESLAITRPRWRNALQNLGLNLAIERELGQLPLIRGDSAALRELVTNLILNALDAMPEGGVLGLRTALVPAPAGPPGQMTALLEVSDTGVGMAPEVQKRIFDPFFSTKGTRGTGMGLAMVYSTVQRHQGSISVRSAPGQGSIFTLLLPLGQGAVVREGPAAPPADRASAPSRILVVEDDPAVRRVLVQMLQRQGHAVDVASGGAEALACMDGQTYDLLCSDLGMPGMSGWDLISRARAAHPRLRTLLITGWGEQISPDEALARGVDHVLAKPFDSNRLRQVIGSLLGRSRQ